MKNSSSRKIICKTHWNSLLLQRRKQWLREVRSLNWSQNLQVGEPVIFIIPTLIPSNDRATQADVSGKIQMLCGDGHCAYCP